jgi:hypothetical protein
MQANICENYILLFCYGIETCFAIRKETSKALEKGYAIYLTIICLGPYSAQYGAFNVSFDALQLNQEGAPQK